MIESLQQIDRLEVYGRELENLDEAIVVMESVKKRGRTYLGEASLRTDSGADPWSGTRTMGDAIQIARYGWPEGRELIRETLERIDTDELIGMRETMEPYEDVAGDEVDIDRYLSGDHKNMMQYDLRYDQNGKVVDLFVNCSVSAYVTPQQIIKRGAAILAARELLASNGYTMGITMVESTTNHGSTKVEYRIPLIHPGGYMDLDTAAFCLAHPSFLRRLVFALNENEKEPLRERMGFVESGGYGLPSPISLPLPRAALVIDKHEGLDLSSDAEIVDYTKSVITRATAKLIEVTLQE